MFLKIKIIVEFWITLVDYGTAWFQKCITGMYWINFQKTFRADFQKSAVRWQS